MRRLPPSGLRLLTSIKQETCVTNIKPIPSPSLGQKLDNLVADIKTELGVVETDAASDFAKAKAWVVTNWPHFVTWVGGAWIAVKSGALHLL
jgi:hypothetical protein